MSKRFSTTSVRVPCGFGALLEGLTREILRDQPSDIPKYAAAYFTTLLKRREESGTNPSEWAAQLEDSYCSNQPSDIASKLTSFNKTPMDTTAEDYSVYSEDDVSMATDKISRPDDAHLTESKKEESSSPIITQAESAGGPPAASADLRPSTHSQSDELSNEIDNKTVSHHSESYSETHDEQLLKERTQDARSSKICEDGDYQLANQEEDKPGSVNICATGFEDEMADAVSETKEDAESEDAPLANDIRPESPVSQMEITEQRLASNETDTEPPIVADLDKTEDKSLVEIDFEDVPENHQTCNQNYLNMDTIEKNAIFSQDGAELDCERQEDDAEDDDYREGSMGKAKEGNLQDECTEENDEEKSSEKDGAEFNHELSLESTLMAEHMTYDSKTDVQPETEQRTSVESDAESSVPQLFDSTVGIMDKGGDNSSGEDEEEHQQEQSLDKYLPKELVSDEAEEEGEELEEIKSVPEDKDGPPTSEQVSANADLDKTVADIEDSHLQEDQLDALDPQRDTNDQQEECSRPQEEEDIMDIPLDDPEANRAAAKIQAGFRGHMTRKKMKPEDKTEGEERQDDRGQ